MKCGCDLKRVSKDFIEFYFMRKLMFNKIFSLQHTAQNILNSIQCGISNILRWNKIILCIYNKFIKTDLCDLFC